MWVRGLTGNGVVVVARPWQSHRRFDWPKPLELIRTYALECRALENDQVACEECQSATGRGSERSKIGGGQDHAGYPQDHGILSWSVRLTWEALEGVRADAIRPS